MDMYIPEGLQKQRDWIAEQARIEQPCWACGVPSSQYDAAGVADPKDFKPWNAAGVTFCCPYCDTPMVVSVPLVAAGPAPWFWMRPSGLVVTATEWQRQS